MDSRRYLLYLICLATTQTSGGLHLALRYEEMFQFCGICQDIKLDLRLPNLDHMFAAKRKAKVQIEWTNNDFASLKTYYADEVMELIKVWLKSAGLK